VLALRALDSVAPAARAGAPLPLLRVPPHDAGRVLGLAAKNQIRLTPASAPPV
jgi:hypothetical protein